MVTAPWTAVRDTPNKSARQNVARLGVVLHHAAMTSLSGLRSMEVNGTKQVSSTAICKDNEIELIVPNDAYRPWSLSSAYWDSAMRSVETCNESTTGWTVSDASHWSLARAVAYWAEQDGFYPHRDGDPTTWTVIGHREVSTIHGASYATACPGGLDLNLVTARAQGLLNGIGTAGSASIPIKPVEEDEDMPIAIKPNVLIWNGIPNAYDGQVFDAIVSALGLEVHDADWKFDTVIREAWRANDFLAGRIAQAAAGATVGALRTAGVNVAGTVDAEAIAKQVIAALPKAPTSYTVTPN